MGECADVCFCIDRQEVRLVNFLAIRTLVCVSFLSPSALQDAEDDNIKTLIDMGGMQRIADNRDPVRASILEKSACIVGVVSIDEE